MLCLRSSSRLLCVCLSLGLLAALPLMSGSVAAEKADAKKAAAKKAAAKKAAAKKTPARPKRPAATGLVVGENRATPVERIKAAEGFQGRIALFGPQLPSKVRGSICASIIKDAFWRAISTAACIAFRLRRRASRSTRTSIEKVPAEIRAINGMVWAFDALYVAVNDYEKKIDSGLYRITDSDGDDRLDKVELLRRCRPAATTACMPSCRRLMARGCTWSPATARRRRSSTLRRVTPCWGEDHLLPRMPDGRGFMREVLGPGGIIYRVTPDGKHFEVVSSGLPQHFRRGGQRATASCSPTTPTWNTTSIRRGIGRRGSAMWSAAANSVGATAPGKRPEWYPRQPAAGVEYRPGFAHRHDLRLRGEVPGQIPAGVVRLDWSWGKMYAVHLQPTAQLHGDEGRFSCPERRCR